ncbi:MAG: TadE/TadG family type IV pilus assembly protein [Sphingobium sp.]
MMDHILFRIMRAFFRLGRDTSAVAMVEFAYAAPVLLVLITGGAELANYAITNMRVSALALQVADNAARMGSGDPMQLKVISEAQINDILQGALAQGGTLNINGTGNERQANETYLVKNKARIIISSLEPDPNVAHVNKNWIHWQRCYGQATEYLPQYGAQGLTNLAGMGPAGRQVYAPAGTEVMFVEVHYRYAPLFPVVRAGMFGIMNYKDMNTVAAMIVRDDRSVGAMPDNAQGVAISTC